MSNLDNSNSASSKNLCTTDVRFDEVEFDWTIHHFDFHEIRGDGLWSSLVPCAANDKLKWRLQCLPNGVTYEEDTISIFLYLITDVRVNMDMYVEFTISTLNRQQKVTNVERSIFRYFNPIAQNWGFSEYLVKNDEFRDELFLNNHTLTLRCGIKYSEMKNIHTNFHRCKSKIPPCTLAKDLTFLFENQEFSDVTLTVQDKDYYVHKAILAARSPVFAAMFRHKTIETEQNRVVIEDLNKNVIGELLRYIYTGKCLTPKEIAGELLVAADKYAVDGLKAICMQELSELLEVGNAVSTLVFADQHGAEELKIEAINFIKARFIDIVKTKTWKDLLVLNPQLAGEVCEAFAQK